MKIKIDGKSYESIIVSCGLAEEYFDVIDSLEETKGKFLKKDRKAIKEFICLVFDSKFTTDDIDKYLEFADLIIYFRLIGEEIQDKTNKKFEKLSKK